MELTDIRKDYRKGKSYLDGINLFSRVETCYSFVNGDQWKGLKYSGERPPRLNVLLPMMKGATSIVGQNNVNIQYTSMNYGSDRKELLAVCGYLNVYAKKLWEKLKFDRLVWDVIEDSYIAGDSYVYFYDDEKKDRGDILCEVISTTNIMFGDENQSDIQKQPYILIAQRKSVREVQDMARSRGVSQEEINNIIPDTEPNLQLNGESVQDKNAKVTLIAKMWKQDGCVHIMRSTKTVVIQPETAIKGMSLYPVAGYTWKPRKGSARGDGDVWDKIPNQISINKSLFRLEQAVKNAAYPIKVYRGSAITQPQAAKLNQPGRSISLQGGADAPIANVISYLQPGTISSHATSYWQDLINLTRELSPGSESLEDVNPEQASGTAIKRALELRTMSVKRQIFVYKQFVEDIARIWYDIIIAYNPGGLLVENEDTRGNGQTMIISRNTLKALDVDIKVDIVDSSETFAAVKDRQLKDFLDKGHITFNEYVSALEDSSTMPVTAFRRIVQNRLETARYIAENTAGGGDEYEVSAMQM